VLLSTPLALSIKTHLPRAQVDYLVFKGTEEALANNPHVRRVHTLSPRSSGLGSLVQLWRRYDYSIGAGWSDRTTIFCFACGRRRLGFRIPARQDWWKQHLLHYCRTFDGGMHMVPLMLTQLEPLGIPRIPRVVLEFNAGDAAFARKQLGGRPFILLHPYSRRSFKFWPASAWATLAEMIRSRTGLRAVFTRSHDQSDHEQLRRIEREAGGAVESLPQPFTLRQLAAAIHDSRAFVGIDTAATHVAAAVGAPTVAIYGPTSASLWGPWPIDYMGRNPFAARAPFQACGSVTVLQQSWPCAPCGRETCRISQRGKIECLENLQPESAFAALAKSLSNDLSA
jgi:heptosyltransferase III